MNDEFEVVVVLWEDHIRTDRSSIPSNPDELFQRPTLSIGVLLKETPKSILVVSDIERYDDRDEGTYMVILKNSILGIKKYGTIQIENLRFR
jgi:hypothetical protein